MFKIKRIDIDSGNKFNVVLLEEDASELGLHSGDRVRVCSSKHCSLKRRTFLVCELLIAKSSFKDVKLRRREAGIFKCVFEKLELEKKSRITIVPASKPKSLEYVRDKFRGKIRLSQRHFDEIITDIVLNRYSDIETTFFVLSCASHPLDDRETIALTRAMINAGRFVSFKELSENGVVVDKHCIGGIPGNRTTMLVTPIVAAAGLIIPKTSSRAITSPAGTADTMEVIANVDLSLSQMDEVVRSVCGCIVWGGGLDLSPADDVIVNVEHPLEIDSEGQMIASILSKKVSAGATHVLLDIPIGRTAKYDKTNGMRLKKRFEKISRVVGLNMKVVISDGSSPIGKGIGPLLEIEDILKVLNNSKDQPMRLRDKAIWMSGILLEIGGAAKIGKGEDVATLILDSGLAKKKFDEIIDAQGRKKLPRHAKFKYDYISQENGKIASIHNRKISKLSFMLGNPNDKAAGIYIHKSVCDEISKGDVIFTIYSNSKTKLKYSIALIEDDNPITLK